MRLRDYLSVPYLLEAETVEVAPGSWIRRVAYPELPGCTAESLVVEDALRLLERMRIEMIVAMVGEGLASAGPAPAAAELRSGMGCRDRQALSDEIIALIDRDEPRQPDTND